jgi:hypothetical protein
MGTPTPTPTTATAADKAVSKCALTMGAVVATGISPGVNPHADKRYLFGALALIVVFMIAEVVVTCSPTPPRRARALGAIKPSTRPLGSSTSNMPRSPGTASSATGSRPAALSNPGEAGRGMPASWRWDRHRSAGPGESRVGGHVVVMTFVMGGRWVFHVDW